MTTPNTLTRRALVAVAAGAALAAVPHLALTHHSFPATYHVDQEVTIEGHVVQFQFRNPHSFIHVMVIEHDDDGEEVNRTRWAIEWGSSGALAQERITRSTLNPGDEVVVRGSPGRNPADNRLLLRHISRPGDGWEWGGEFN